MLILNAKQMGFSLEEIAIFRLRDLVEMTNIYVGEGNNVAPKVRDATQEDINNFLG